MLEVFCCQVGTWESGKVSAATGITTFLGTPLRRYSRAYVSVADSPPALACGQPCAWPGRPWPREQPWMCPWGGWMLRARPPLLARGGAWSTIQVRIGILPNGKPLPVCQLTYAWNNSWNQYLAALFTAAFLCQISISLSFQEQPPHTLRSYRSVWGERGRYVAGLGRPGAMLAALCRAPLLPDLGTLSRKERGGAAWPSPPGREG